jgi:CHASE2 domain-containing sensor protein
MSKKWYDPHALYVTLVIFLIIGLFSRIHLNLHFLDPLSHSIKDYEVTDIVYSQIRDQTVEPDSQIVLVNSGWPDRTRISAMLDRILEADAAVVGVDIFFSGAKNPFGDSLLQASIMRGGERIVLATALCDYDPELGQFKTVAVDDSMFSNYTRTGFANFPGNPTRTVRHFSASEIGPDGPVPAFAVEIARAFRSDADQILRQRGHNLERIHYSATEDHFIRFEPEHILDTTVDLRPLLAGKMVILGYSGSGEWNEPLLDRYFTPLNPRYTGKSTPDMYGMVIHANIIRMLLRGTFINTVPAWVNGLLAFLICYLNLIVLIWISHRYHGVYHPIARLIQIVQFAIYFFIIAFLFERFRLKWDFSLGLIALALAVDTQLVYFALRNYIHRRFFGRNPAHSGH